MMYSELVQAIREAADTEVLYFDRPIRAKISTYSAPIEVVGVDIKGDVIQVMDRSLQWRAVEDRPEDERIIQKLSIFFHVNQ